MKYSEKNRPIQCMMTNSTCYKGTTPGEAVGVLWHSTGAKNTSIGRYVQPSENDVNYKNLLALIGKNKYQNDWNHQYTEAGVNAFIGKLANGEVSSVEVLPLNYRPWGCGSGKNGSCNGDKNVKNSPFWLQFEICEDGLTDKAYFEKVYREGVELTAYWCKLFNLDPFGTVTYKGVKVPVILDHAESYKLGLGSNHGDIIHWLKKYGKSLETIRQDVYNLLHEEEDEDMTQEKFNEMMNNWLAEQAKLDPSSWSKNDRTWAEKNGIIKGDDQGRKMYKKFVTREEMVTMLHRTHDLG